MINTDTQYYQTLINHKLNKKKKINKTITTNNVVTVFDREHSFTVSTDDWSFLSKFYWRFRDCFFTQIGTRRKGIRTIKWVRLNQILIPDAEPPKRDYRTTKIIESDGKYRVFVYGLYFDKWSLKTAEDIVKGVTNQIDKYGLTYFHPKKKELKKFRPTRNQKRKAKRLC